MKNAEGAPNYLVGYWQNDWQHLMHDHNQQATVALYPDLPFTITEVMALHDDGTGYLRTVKTYKDGTNEVALDPFSYVLTDYHGGEQYNYHGYYYKCYFAAGDAIEYLVRSYDNMQTLYNGLYYVNYPWFRQTGDNYERYEGSKAELTVYKYNTGFMINEGFSKDGAGLNFDPTIVPQGVTIKATLNGSTLEMEGWNTYQRED